MDLRLGTAQQPLPRAQKPVLPDIDFAPLSVAPAPMSLASVRLLALSPRLSPALSQRPLRRPVASTRWSYPAMAWLCTHPLCRGLHLALARPAPCLACPPAKRPSSSLPRGRHPYDSPSALAPSPRPPAVPSSPGSHAPFRLSPLSAASPPCVLMLRTTLRRAGHATRAVMDDLIAVGTPPAVHRRLMSRTIWQRPVVWWHKSCLCRDASGTNRGG